MSVLSNETFLKRIMEGQSHTFWTQWEIGDQNEKNKHKTGSKKELAPWGFPV